MITARPLRLASIALSVAAFTAGLVTLPDVAGADRVRVRVGGGGRVHIRGGGHVRIAGPRGYYRPYAYRPYSRSYPYRPHYRHHYRPHVRYHYPRPYYYYGPTFYWGWGFRYAYPPPPPCYYYDCGARVSAYYSGPAPAATIPAPAPAPPPPLSRFGIGVFGGGVDVEGNDAGTDLGLIGRLRLTRHFVLEAEVSKTEIDEGARVDRRLGGALLYDFSPHGDLSPYILGGGGFGQTEVDDGRFTAEQAYGEVGVGLEWRLGRHIALFGDLRAGVRESNASEDDLMFLAAGGGDGGPSVDDNEQFTRARIGALLNF